MNDSRIDEKPGDEMPVGERDPSEGVMWRSGAIDHNSDNEQHERGQPYSLNVPGAMLREASSVSDLGLWYAIGEAWSHMAVAVCREPNPRIVDIGCGCGKMARFFAMNPGARYLGLDVYYPSIKWCREEFSRLDRYRFEHIDVHSSLYNTAGTIMPDAVSLPVEDGSTDLVICGSLFTHLLEPAFDRYVSEIGRILSPGARALISTHNEPETGEFSGDERRIDIGDRKLKEIVDRHGLRFAMPSLKVYGQQVHVLEGRT